MTGQLWLKHRPDTMRDMVDLDSLKADSASWSVAGSLRCGGVIFHGPPGTGKSSAARAIAKDMLGDTFDTNYHVFNASDDRGIGFVRDRLKPLAEQKATGHGFKIINVDEADGLTSEAQDAMKEIVERTSPHVLWIFTCNRVSRIIPALRSRLPTYRFTGLSGDEAYGFLTRVIEIEGLPEAWKDSVVDLLKRTKGDLRACLKTMQVCNPDDPEALAQTVSLHDDDVMDFSLSIVAHEWENAMKAVERLEEAGVTRFDVIEGIHEVHMDLYRDDEVPLNTVLLHLLILGQWAARSPDWVSGDGLFLRAMLGDYNKRCV